MLEPENNGIMRHGVKVQQPLSSRDLFPEDSTMDGREVEAADHKSSSSSLLKPLKGNELDLTMPGGDVGGHVQIFMIEPTESTLPPEPTGIRNPGGRRRSDSPPSTNHSWESSITIRNVMQSVRREFAAEPPDPQASLASNCIRE